MNRRTVLAGLLAAPMVVRTSGLLMPVRAMWTARELELIRKGWEFRNGMWWKRVAITIRDIRTEWAAISP